MRKSVVLIAAMLALMLAPSAGLAQFGHHRHHGGGHGRIHNLHYGGFHGGFVGHHRHIGHIAHHGYPIHFGGFRHRHYGGLALAAAGLGYYGPWSGPYGYGIYSAPVYRDCFLERRWVRSSHGPHRVWVRVCV